MSGRIWAHPGGLVSVDELRKLITDDRVRTITLAVPDLHGRLMGKRHQAPLADQLLAEGSEACAYLLATDVEMRPLPGYELASWGTGYGDLRLRPDLATLRVLPWDHGGALVIADAHQPDGQAISVAPREVLREQMRQLAALGLTARCGLETEFVAYTGTGKQALRPLVPLASDNLDYALTPPLEMSQYLTEIEDALCDAGLPLEAAKTEAAPGQMEITFRYGPVMEAADNHTIFKLAVKTISQTLEATPTFMAAPETGVGSGLHIHLSLWRGDEPAFPAEGGGLSQTGAHAVAGLVEVLPQVMPLLLPNPNSYKRLRTSSFAPTRASWGWDNRTAAIRVTGHGRGVHLEIRIPGADANPYLALAACLAACRHGIEQELLPPAAITGNAYDCDAPLLPRDLPTALARFEYSRLAPLLLGATEVEHYTTAARIECDHASRQVTDIERNRGFTHA
ncbi:glutamine synthetase family protein [Actinacidiphila rubida]|uniref:Glutamate--putrescine ligase n=1 Tax=Actinacidiphila rubida TaxID=310780 RepID=A0A1H8TR93_9ACTN|nr:glutamine synthetase family protein [Actinacidiphila rubida]SEO93385.1 glutamate--putrescine ligase [Actinacidiphila rubida]